MSKYFFFSDNFQIAFCKTLLQAGFPENFVRISLMAFLDEFEYEPNEETHATQ